MENIELFENTDAFGNVTENVIIRYDDGSFTSMPKSVYDELQAKQNEGMK